MISSIREFMRLEIAAGLVLVVAAMVAMIVANSPWSGHYTAWLAMPVSLGIAPFTLSKTVLHWINDGLMAVFFLVVGLEIKREILTGELSSRRRATLPVIGAIGGMVGPVLVFLAINGHDSATRSGWPIPTATDIAFALGVFALVGKRLPPGLRVFLLGLAIIDDLGAIVLIAVLFTNGLSAGALGLGAACVVALVALNRSGHSRLPAYLLVGCLLWLFVLKSGVHATLAGVITGLSIPLRGGQQGSSPLAKLEHGLHPWVVYLIMPVFAFANAGVPLAGLTLEGLVDPLTLGVAAGLFVGKQVGVFVACWLAVRAGIARLPTGVAWPHFYGVAILTGIGFTMSLFIGSLAFEPGLHDSAIRIGVLAGSLMSACFAGIWIISLPQLNARQARS